MQTVRWYVTIMLFRIFWWLRWRRLAERWATWSGLREALLRGLG